MSHFRLDGRVLNDTEYLRFMRQLEQEAYDDGDTYTARLVAPPPSLPTLATRESLLAAFATTMDANRPAADRPLSVGDQAPLLMVWGWW